MLHSLKFISIRSKKNIVSVEEVLSIIRADTTFSNNELVKCILLLEDTPKPYFIHAEPIIVQKKDEQYNFFCISTDLPEYIDIFESKTLDAKFVVPKYELKGSLVSVLGNGKGCLELAVYALEKLDLETGIILNGQKGHAITELKNGDKYTTEELAKLTRSEKYLKANGVNPQKLIVTNTEGKEMTLAEYRAIYRIGDYNQLLNMLSESSQRVPVKRVNSLEDLQKLLKNASNEEQKGKIAEIIKKRKGS